MYKRTTLVLFIVGYMISALVAQPAVELHVSDETIGAKDAVEVTYEFKNISRPDMPDVRFDDWDVNGPSISQRTSIINGNATSSFSYIYTLYPKHIGTLKVPGITYDYNGKKISCRDQTVKVLQKEHVKKKPAASNSPFGSLLQGMPVMPGMGFPDDVFGAPSAPPPTSGVIVQPGQSYDEAAKRDFFIKITPSKSTFYIGEPILVDYEFFGAANCSWKPESFPSFNGFSVTDIETSLYPYDVKVNGRQYRARGIRKAQLVALKTGRLPLDSAIVEVQTTFIDATNPADRNRATAKIKSKPSFVTVLPLPAAGRPEDFSGAIGQFKIRATVDENKLPAGENNRLHIHISGTGNLDEVTVPDIAWPEGVQAYDARDSQSVNKMSFPMERSVDFEIPFIGNQEGGVKLPPIVFSYFDPDLKQYVTDSTESIAVQFTAPIHDNRVGQSLNSNHTTNRQYLWIVAAIAGLLILVFGASEYRKNKKARSAPPQQPAAAGGHQRVTGAAPAKMQSQQKTAGQPEPKAGTVPDHMQYLPQGLEGKIKPQSQRPGNDELTEQEDVQQPPVKSRAELREEALRELAQRLDPKEFFVLAKAYIIEELQYQLDSSQTDENQLLEQLKERRPDLQEALSGLIKTCNKGLYLPISSEQAASDRAAVLTKIESMIHGDA